MAMRRLQISLLLIGGALALVGIASANETITYSYDAKGRLVKVVHTGTVNNNVIANYTYDKADNRANLNVSGAP